jgi:predicted Zn-dependent protease
MPAAGAPAPVVERPGRRRVSVRETLTTVGGVVVLGVVVFAAAARLTAVDGPARDRLELPEERAAADAWQKEGLRRLGDARTDEVASAVQQNVVGVGRALGEAFGGRAARAVVVQNDQGDALVLPDGSVVVTTGLLSRFQSEAELAAVTAHELAHVALGHVAGALAPSVPTIRSATLAGTSSVVAATMTPLLRSAFSPEQETATDALAHQALLDAGWDASRYAQAIRIAAAASSGWARQHGVDDGRVQALAGVEASGRAGDADYRSRVLGPLGALPPEPAAPAAPPAADARGEDEDEDDHRRRPASDARHPSTGGPSVTHPR